MSNIATEGDVTLTVQTILDLAINLEKKGCKLTDEVTITNTLYPIQMDTPVTLIEVNDIFFMAYNDIM